MAVTSTLARSAIRLKLRSAWPTTYSSHRPMAVRCGPPDRRFPSAGVRPTWQTARTPGPLGASDLATIELIESGSVVATIASGAPNTGLFNWSIPADLAPASDYRIRVTAGSLADESNGDFAITAPVQIYYVNDASVSLGDWTTGRGRRRQRRPQSRHAQSLDPFGSRNLPTGHRAM